MSNCFIFGSVFPGGGVGGETVADGGRWPAAGGRWHLDGMIDMFELVKQLQKLVKEKNQDVLAGLIALIAANNA